MLRVPVLTLAIAAMSASVLARNLAYVKFNGATYAQTLTYVRALSDRGFQPVHVFAPNEVILNAFKLPGKSLLSADLPFAVVITADTVVRSVPADPSRGELAYESLVDYWTSGQQAEPMLPLNYPEVLDSVTLSEMDALSLQRIAALPAVASDQQYTGQYMIGSIAVGIYLMESNGGTENWTPDSERRVQNEIVEGLDWLSVQGEQRGARVTWVYPVVEKVPTSDEPINGHSMPYFQWTTLNWQFGWLSSVYTSHGLPSEWSGAFALANQLRGSYKTNWAVEITVVMDENDPDHMFTDDLSAFVMPYWTYDFPCCASEQRSPVVMMTYYNGTPAGSYYPFRMNDVAKHEVSHAFGASDEYSGVHDCNDDDACSKSSSYLQTPNGNCEYCNANAVDCYMAHDPAAICSFTPPELGWRDQWRVNGIPDPIDENTGLFMWLHNVAAGDRIVVTDFEHIVNIISVTPEMLLGSSNNIIHWDGTTLNDQIASPYNLYLVTRNGQTIDQNYLQFVGTPTGHITNHQYLRDTLSYYNSDSYAYLRHVILDSVGEVYARPRFDVMTNRQTTVKAPLTGYKDGIYTSKVNGYRSDSHTTLTSEYRFITYICGDLNNSGVVDMADLSALVSYITGGGFQPPHRLSGDLNCSGLIDLNDLSRLVSYLTGGGAQFTCCHTL